VFNNRFTEFTEAHQQLHLVAIVLIACSIALIMTPAAYHRQVEPGTVSDFFVKMASCFVTLAMVPLMLGICIEVYLLAHLILSSEGLGMMLAGALLAAFAGLWFIFPHVMRIRRHWS
jgi:uncharacterized oligopeptide transporter (OPT) family protein